MIDFRSKCKVVVAIVCMVCMVFSCKEASHSDEKTTSNMLQTNENHSIADSLFEVGRQLYFKRNFDASVYNFLRADTIYQSQNNTAQSLKSRINIATALQALYIENDSIDRFLRTGIPLIEKLDHQALEAPEYYNKLQEVNYANGNYAAAKLFAEKAYRKLVTIKDTENQSYKSVFYYTVHALTINQQELFNYEAAENFAKLTVDYAKQKNYNRFNAEMELFNTYVLSNSFTKAAKQLAYIESEGLVDEKDIFSAFDFFRAKIHFYTKNKDYQNALIAVNDLQRIIDASGYKEHFSQWFLTQSKSDLFLEMGKFEKVIAFINNLQIDPNYEKATINYRSADFLKLAKAYYHLADSTTNNKELWQQNIQKAINLHLPKEKQTTDFFAKVSYENARFKDFLYTRLLFKAKAAFETYQKTTNKHYLEIALHTFKEAHANLKTLGALSNEDEFIDAETFEEFYTNLLVAFHKKWSETADAQIFFDALTISDESKNIFILNELKRTSEKRLFANIPKEIQIREMQLQSELEKTAYTVEYDQINEKFALFKQEIRAQFPKYYALKYGEKKPLKDVIDSQLKGYNCISYTMTNEYLFIFNYNAGDLQFDKITLNTALKENLQAYLGSIRNFTTTSYKDAGKIIYKTILEKYIDTEKPTILLLDGNLNLIPFDLFRSYTTYQKPFIRLHNLHQDINDSSSQENTAIVFAPLLTKNENSENALQLPSSYKEATAIENVTNAVLKTGQLASKQTFIETSQTYDVIHLTTHSQVNMEFPLQSEILFYQKRNDRPEQYILKAKSLYDMEFSANMVTLSSCESGVATQQSGRGLQSISNAFHYAGAKSTVMSLWKVPDRTTATLMGLFYENLQAGMNKAEALQKAKEKYVAQTDDDLFKHPYYWAGFVISGDISPITFPKTTSMYYYLLFGICILAVDWILYNRSKKKKTHEY